MTEPCPRRYFSPLLSRVEHKSRGGRGGRNEQMLRYAQEWMRQYPGLSLVIMVPTKRAAYLMRRHLLLRFTRAERANLTVQSPPPPVVRLEPPFTLDWYDEEPL